MRRILLAGLVLFLLGVGFSASVWAEECDPNCSGIEECQRKISECQKRLEQSVGATKPHEEKAAQLEKDIAALEANVASLANQIEEKKQAIDRNEKKLADRQEVLNAQVRDFYKKDYSSSFEYLLTVILSTGEVNEKIKVLTYRETLINEEKRFITSLAMELADLALAKKEYEATKDWLEERKSGLEAILVPVRQLIAEAKSYQTTLSQTVGTLSAKQQQFLAERTGNFQTSVGDVPLADDVNASIDGFRNSAPAGSTAIFSFGAPHFKGMSQYGAYGRAKSGQSTEDILRAYYGGGIEIKKDYSADINITVQGHGSVDIETYTKRIYEMPASWTDNDSAALKAQAVAARSYALAYTNNGAGSICATESCQVYKPANKGGAWDAAVDATKGWVLMAGGRPFSAWYSSTSGGYMESYANSGHATPGFWDTKCGNQGCWTGEAYEKVAGSPWFYKAWYKSRNGATCGRNNPWLNGEEFSDLVNAAIVYSSGGDTSGIFPEDINSCFGRSEGPWSKDRMREEANKHGGAVTSVAGVSVTYSTSGVTSTVKFQTNRGEISLSGSQFRTAFNLRAPSKVYLPSGLYNIERK